MWIILLAVLTAVLLVFLLLAALQHDEFVISRSIVIAAPPSDCFAQVNDFHRWAAWSPWEKLDPFMERGFEGPEAGEGAIYHWSGRKKVGEGGMTLVKSVLPGKIRIRLDFLRPLKTTNQIEFDFQPAGPGTRVTWTMDGKRGLAAKAFHLLFSMEKMVGPEFENGLARLKAEVESFRGK